MILNAPRIVYVRFVLLQGAVQGASAWDPLVPKRETQRGARVVQQASSTLTIYALTAA